MPPSSDALRNFGDPTEENADLDDELIAQLRVIHHNPHLLIDPELENLDSLMEHAAFSPTTSSSEGTKRRKREDASPINSNTT